MKWFFLLTGLFATAHAALAAGPTMTRVTAIEALDKATMYSRQKVYLGVSCRTAPEGDVEWLKQAKIGDTVFLGKNSFKVGIIETVAFSEDLKTKGGKLLAAKGDTQCVLAANEQSLPYDQKRCDGLWVFIPKCRVTDPIQPPAK